MIGSKLNEQNAQVKGERGVTLDQAELPISLANFRSARLMGLLGGLAFFVTSSLESSAVRLTAIWDRYTEANLRMLTGTQSGIWTTTTEVPKTISTITNRFKMPQDFVAGRKYNFAALGWQLKTNPVTKVVTEEKSPLSNIFVFTVPRVGPQSFSSMATTESREEKPANLNADSVKEPQAVGEAEHNNPAREERKDQSPEAIQDGDNKEAGASIVERIRNSEDEVRKIEENQADQKPEDSFPKSAGSAPLLGYQHLEDGTRALKINGTPGSMIKIYATENIGDPKAWTLRYQFTMLTPEAVVVDLDGAPEGLIYRAEAEPPLQVDQQLNGAMAGK